MSYNILEDGHVSSPNGFRATGIAGGLKEVRARDLALVYSQQACRAAGVFTTSTVVAAPVFFDQAILARNREQIRAVLANAGQANAGTGQQGLNDAGLLVVEGLGRGRLLFTTETQRMQRRHRDRKTLCRLSVRCFSVVQFRDGLDRGCCQAHRLLFLRLYRRILHLPLHNDVARFF